MKRKRLERIGPCMLAALLLVGACAGGEAQPSSGARPASRIVFQVSYSAGGQLTVSEDPSGFLGMGITGTVGIDDPHQISGKVRARSPVATFQALLPGVTVPAQLVRLNERFEKQDHLLPSGPAGDVQAVEAARVVASAQEEAFRQEFCRNRQEPDGTATVFLRCKYSDHTGLLNYYIEHQIVGDFVSASYARNDSSTDAAFWGPGNFVSLEPGQWGLLGWGGSGEARIDLEGIPGPLGLTEHLMMTGT
jgi:hypothetical protein